MTANSQLLTTTPKAKTKANKNGNGTTDRELTWRVINRGVEGGEKGERYRE